MPKSVAQVQQEIMGDTRLWRQITEDIDRVLPQALDGKSNYATTYLPGSTPQIMLEALENTYRPLGWKLVFSDGGRDGINVHITVIGQSGQ